MQTLGEVERIWRYPVKSLAAQLLARAEIAPDGIPGDRAGALLVESGHARMGKTYRGKENRFLHLTASEDAAVRFARDQDVAVRVVREDAHYYDAAPVSIIFDRWLNEVSALVGYELEPLRYRPNIFARAHASFTGAERDYIDAVLHVGTAVLKVRKPIARCVTTTYDQRTGDSDPEVLRAVAQHRETFLGIYCDGLQPGTVKNGDAVMRE